MRDQKISERKYFLICTGILLLAYLPVFLAYYPGIFSYDVDTQIPQYLTGYSKHHNLIHTLYLHFFYYFIGGNVLHSYTAGITCATITQMILFAGMISYIHLFLRRAKVNKIVRIAVLIFTAVFPFFSMLSISMTKDVLFAGFVGILSVCLYYWETDEAVYQSGKKCVLYIFAVVGTVLFRNNGIYAVLISFMIGLIFLVICRKNYRYLFCTVLGISFALLISAGMGKLLSASNGSPNEMLSVPYQQLSYIYETEYEKLTQEEREGIESYIPDVENYKPYISDPVKANATGAYQKKNFLIFYLKLFTKYPVQYFEAFFIHNAGYFDITDKTHAEIYGADLEERQGYLLSDTKEGFGVEHVSYLKPLEDFYEKLFSENQYQKSMILRILCSPATYFWTIMGLFIMSIIKKQYSFVQFSMVFGMILTLLAGPCVLIRYALPYIVCIPVLAVSVFGMRKE